MASETNNAGEQTMALLFDREEAGRALVSGPENSIRKHAHDTSPANWYLQKLLASKVASRAWPRSQTLPRGPR